jgi:hypothetical protein
MTGEKRRMTQHERPEFTSDDYKYRPITKGRRRAGGNLKIHEGPKAATPVVLANGPNAIPGALHHTPAPVVATY